MSIKPLLPSLSGPDLTIAWAPFEALHGTVDSEEWEDIASAAPARQQEFTAGRLLARLLADTLGLPPAPLRRAVDRSPLWPADRTGSLSHCDTLCAAVVGKRSAVKAVGIDIESIGRAKPKLWSALFTERETDYLASLELKTAAIESTLFFSAKEAFYKCQYPLTQEWVAFKDVEVTRTDNHSLAITTTRSAARHWHAAPIHAEEISDSHVATVMLLPA